MANAARKTSFAVIPGVPGCTYYLTVKGKDRTLICTENRGNKVVLADLKAVIGILGILNTFRICSVNTVGATLPKVQCRKLK